MRIILLQEAMAAGPLMLIGLLVGLTGIILIFFLGGKITKLRSSIRVLEKTDDVAIERRKNKIHFFMLDPAFCGCRLNNVGSQIFEHYV